MASPDQSPAVGSVASGQTATPGQLLHALWASCFSGGGWVDEAPGWDDFDADGHAKWEAATKNPGFRFDGSGKSFQTESVNRHVADICGPRHEAAGIKQGGSWFHDNKSASRMHSSKSPARKAASAKIAKIPFALSSHIARVYCPKREAA